MIASHFSVVSVSSAPVRVTRSASGCQQFYRIRAKLSTAFRPALDFSEKADIIKTEDTATSGWLPDKFLDGLLSPKTRHFAEWRVFLWVKRIMTVTGNGPT